MGGRLDRSGSFNILPPRTQLRLGGPGDRTSTILSPPSEDEATGGPFLAIGEVRTGLLRHGATLPPEAVAQLLELVPGEPVRQSERPIAHALSADVANGVDCNLATESGGRVRAVGTVLTHAAVTGGRIVQASSYARVDSNGVPRRRPWSYYTAKPGVCETLPPAKPHELEAGYLKFDQLPDCLDLAAIGERLIWKLQKSPLLDGGRPMRFQWTRVRWTAQFGQQTGSRKPAARLVIEDDTLRSLTLVVPPPPNRAPAPVRQLEAILELCRDLALHDWALTTLTRRVDRVDPGSGDRARVIAELTPVIDHLLHLWMPAARVGDHLAQVWQAFESRPGFTRQWTAAEARVRNQIALHTLQLLDSRSAQPAATVPAPAQAERASR